MVSVVEIKKTTVAMQLEMCCIKNRQWIRLRTASYLIVNLFNIYNQGVNAAINSASCDLYKHIYRLLDLKQVQLKVRWMPSHLGFKEQDSRPSDIFHFDVLANDQADFHAGKAASKVQISDDVAFKHISSIDLALKFKRD